MKNPVMQSPALALVVLVSFFLVGCTGASQLDPQPLPVEIEITGSLGPGELGVAINAEGGVVIRGGFRPKARFGLGPVTFEAAVQESIKLTQDKKYYLIIIWQDKRGEMQMEEYEIGTAFTVHFKSKEHVHRVQGDKDNVYVVVATDTISDHVPPTGTSHSLETVEDFANYADETDLRAAFVANASWGTNSATIGLGRANGNSFLQLDYNLTTTVPGRDYIVMDRCYEPVRNWTGASGINLHVRNDSKPKQLVFQFGEGYRCSPGEFPFEVWRKTYNLPPGHDGNIELLFDYFEQETGWAKVLNRQIDLSRIGYLAIGIRGPGVGRGTVEFGPISLIK